MAKELWITFYDIEKSFDSLWLEDCINALGRNGIQDDTPYLVHLMNQKANITVKTPFGDTDPFISTDIVKQGTSLGGDYKTKTKDLRSKTPRVQYAD